MKSVSWIEDLICSHYNDNRRKNEPEYMEKLLTLTMLTRVPGEYGKRKGAEWANAALKLKKNKV